MADDFNKDAMVAFLETQNDMDFDRFVSLKDDDEKRKEIMAEYKKFLEEKEKNNANNEAPKDKKEKDLVVGDLPKEKDKENDKPNDVKQNPQQEPEPIDKEQKQPWPDWAAENGYQYNFEDGTHTVQKDDKESKIKYNGDKVGIKSLDFPIYQKIVKDAKIDDYTRVKIDEKMDKDQSILMIAACLEGGMAYTNGGKTVDLERAKELGLSPEILKLIDENNKKKEEEQKNKESEGNNSENKKTEKREAEQKPEEKASENLGKKADEDNSETTKEVEKSMSGQDMNAVRAHIAKRKAELSARKGALKDKQFGGIEADKIAEETIAKNKEKDAIAKEIDLRRTARQKMGIVGESEFGGIEADRVAEKTIADNDTAKEIDNKKTARKTSGVFNTENNTGVDALAEKAKNKAMMAKRDGR